MGLFIRMCRIKLGVIRMSDVLLWEDEDFRVVSADMGELMPCRICGRMTRTEWCRKKNRLCLWVCSDHEKDEVWNFMLDFEKTKKHGNDWQWQKQVPSSRR